MNQYNIGCFIGAKRREKNLTQVQLAEKLGVSNKTISKWETGKCLPDYSVIELLCKELDVSLAELLDGEEKDPNSIRAYDEEQVKSLLSKIQTMEKDYKYTIGSLMITVGFIASVLTLLFGGSNLLDFISGCLFGLGTSMIVVGVILIIKNIKKGQKFK